MNPAPKAVSWNETLALIDADLAMYEIWFPGGSSARGRWRRVLRAVLRTEMFGANLLYRLQTYLHGAGHAGLATGLGRLSRVLFAVTVGRDVRIGGGLYVAHGHVVVEGSVTIGKNVSIGPFVTVGLISSAGSPFDGRGPQMGDDVFLGTGAKILGPVRIGDRARIGAGAVVLSDVPADHTAVGVPARVRPAGRPAGHPAESAAS